MVVPETLKICYYYKNISLEFIFLVILFDAVHSISARQKKSTLNNSIKMKRTVCAIKSNWQHSFILIHLILLLYRSLLEHCYSWEFVKLNKEKLLAWALFYIRSYNDGKVKYWNINKKYWICFKEHFEEKSNRE